MHIDRSLQTALGWLATSAALVGEAGTIGAHDPDLPGRLGDSPEELVGRPLLDVLPELFGLEEDLEQVRAGRRPPVFLEHVNRTTPSGELRYLNLTVLPFRTHAGRALMVLVTDVTAEGRRIQEINQNRNEMSLLRRRLLEVNDQLELLLHHYLPPEVADGLLAGSLRPELGGEMREVTLLIADARSFSTLAREHTPTEVVELLNEALGVIAEAVTDEGGTLTQFQGDSAVVVFNAPTDQPDHARRAVRAALAAQRGLVAHRAAQPETGPRLRFGIGINTGPALLGNIGARWRYTYTASGDAANLAFRITGATPPDKIWIGAATQAQLATSTRTQPLPPLEFKGQSEPTELFEVSVEPDDE